MSMAAHLLMSAFSGIVAYLIAQKKKDERLIKYCDKRLCEKCYAQFKDEC